VRACTPGPSGTDPTHNKPDIDLMPGRIGCSCDALHSALPLSIMAYAGAHNAYSIRVALVKVKRYGTKMQEFACAGVKVAASLNCEKRMAPIV